MTPAEEKLIAEVRAALVAFRMAQRAPGPLETWARRLELDFAIHDAHTAILDAEPEKGKTP